jgi:Domain of unknown function (DUF222)
LPKIAACMARGELSYSKVRALTRVACQATEESFLMIALHGTAHHVERLVRGYRRAQDAEELSREAQQQTHRSVRYWFAEDGSLMLKARLPALAGALLIEALDAALERVPDHEISAGRCEIENGPALPAETVRRLTCDASLLHLLENEHGEPLDVGRKTRSIPPAIRRALNSRDRGCRFPGCTHQRYLDAHHIEHWADGGDTRWRGERMDHDLGVWVLSQPHAGAPGFDTDGGADVSAETFSGAQWQSEGELDYRPWWKDTDRTYRRSS